MKKAYLYIAIFLLLLTGCMKDAEIKPRDFPFVLTGQVVILDPGASFSAEILDIGDDSIIRYGFTWSESAGHQSTDHAVYMTDPPAVGTYTAKITIGLFAGRTYYVWAFIETENYKVYGNLVSFVSTGGSLPPQITGFSPEYGPVGTAVEITGKNFSTYKGDNIVRFGETIAVIDSVTETRMFVKVPEVTKPGKLHIYVEVAGKSAVSDNLFDIWFPWTEKNDFSGGYLYKPTGFAINGKGYVCFGIIGEPGGEMSNKLWAYDPLSDAWTEKAQFPWLPRYKAVAFVVNEKAYVGLGGVSLTDDNFKDFWEYDPVTDIWTKKADFPGENRALTTAFSIGDRGYVGPGKFWNSSSYDEYPKDFWEYNPYDNTWTRKADFPGSDRDGWCSFSIGEYGYVGMGSKGSPQSNIFRYDPGSDSWEEVGNYPGEGWDDITGFILNGKAFLGFGYDHQEHYFADFWEFNPAGYTWKQLKSCPLRMGPFIGFALGDKGYICIGRDFNWQDYRKKVFEFDPAEN